MKKLLRFNCMLLLIFVLSRNIESKTSAGQASSQSIESSLQNSISRASKYLDSSNNNSYQNVGGGVNSNPYPVGSIEYDLQESINSAKAVLEKLDNGDYSHIGDLINEAVNSINSLSDSIKVYESKKPKLTSIAIDTEETNMKTDYFLGEPLNISGLKVIGVFMQEGNPIPDIRNVPITQNNVKFKDGQNLINFSDITKSGNYELVIQIGNIKSSVDNIIIHIKDPVLQSITLKREPKTNYIQGDDFDKSGMIIEGTYDFGGTKVIENSLVEVSGYDKTKSGEQTVTLKVGDKSLTITVTVKENKLQSIKVTKPPRTEYAKGEEFDKSGMIIEGTYEFGETKVIDNSLVEIVGYDKTKLGEQTVTLKIGEKTIDLTVIVIENADINGDFTIERLYYTPGISFSGEITVILDKPTSKTLSKSDFSIHCPGLNELTTVEVSTESGANKNKVYKLKTGSLRDNRYILEVYLPNGKTLEGEFLVKSDCPIISSPYIIRDSDTTAKFKFNADEAGKLIYLLKEVKASRSLLADNTVTEAELLNSGTKVNIGTNANDISLSNLKANTKYNLYYMTVKSDNKSNSVVYGPVEISNEVEKQSTSDIKIDKVEVKRGNKTQDVVITLSKATSTPLTLANFEIICPADAPLHFNEIDTGSGTNKNKVYTLKMYGGFYDNNYELTITFPDGTYTKGSFRCQLSVPIITSFEAKRISETITQVKFTSSAPGYIYYGFTDEFNDTGSLKKPSITEVVANCPKISINSGINMIKVDNIPRDSVKYMYFVTENIVGRKLTFVDGGKLYKVPIDIKQEIISQTKIENIEVQTNRLKVTLSDDNSASISRDNIEIEGEVYVPSNSISKVYASN